MQHNICVKKKLKNIRRDGRVGPSTYMYHTIFKCLFLYFGALLVYVSAEKMSSRSKAPRRCQLCENSGVKKGVVQIATSTNLKTLDALSKCWMAFTGKKGTDAFADVKWLCQNCAFEFR
jgi:hypothetical protein